MIFGVTLMAILGVSSITPAFPRIVEELHISRTDVGMLIVAFTIPGVILMPFWGMLGDRFGRKRILVPSLILFGLAGGACALARDFSLLVGLRVVQGVGAAALSPLSLTIIGDIFSGERRTVAMGLNASVLSAGAAFYPLLGGALATLAWGYPFLLALAAIPIGVAVLLFMRNPEPRSSGNFREYLAGTWTYLKNIRVIATFMAGVVGFILTFGAYFNYFSLYLGSAFHASPFIIGLITSSTFISLSLVSSQLGRLSRNISITKLVTLGFATCAVGMLLIPLMPHLALLLIPTVIYGAGFAVIFPSLSTYIARVAPSEYRGALMSLNGMMFRLGQTLGPLIIGLAYMWWDFTGAFFFAAGLALATAAIGLVGGKIIH